MANRGPLTTTFTPQGDCHDSATELFFTTNAAGEFYAQGPIDLGSCFPKGYRAQSSEYFSPGICPSGYTVACSDFNSIGTVTETIQKCCPDLYHYTCAFGDHPGWGGCFHDVLTSENHFTALVPVSGTSTGQAYEVTSAKGAINALSIAVRFQSTDLPMLSGATPTPAAPATSSSSSGASAAGPTGIDPAAAGAADEDQGGLTGGAKAGITIGVLLGALALVSAVVYMFLRRRRRRRRMMATGRTGSGAWEKRAPPDFGHAGYGIYDAHGNFMGPLTSATLQSFGGGGGGAGGGGPGGGNHYYCDPSMNNPFQQFAAPSEMPSEGRVHELGAAAPAAPSGYSLSRSQSGNLWSPSSSSSAAGASSVATASSSSSSVSQTETSPQAEPHPGV